MLICAIYLLFRQTPFTENTDCYCQHHNSCDVHHRPNLSSEMNAKNGVVDHRRYTEYPYPDFIADFQGTKGQERTDAANDNAK